MSEQRSKRDGFIIAYKKNSVYFPSSLEHAKYETIVSFSFFHFLPLLSILLSVFLTLHDEFSFSASLKL